MRLVGSPGQTDLGYSLGVGRVLMVRGLTNPDIAARLVIGRSTVKFHVSNILTKLGATSRTEAVAVALRLKVWAGRGCSYGQRVARCRIYG